MPPLDDFSYIVPRQAPVLPVPVDDTARQPPPPPARRDEGAADTDMTPQPKAAPPSVTLDSIREKYPQYEDLSDQHLAEGLHKKFYGDMPFEAFSKKIGYTPPDSTGPAGRIAGEMWKGAKEGFGQPGTILSDEAQAKLDAIRRQGGWRGALAGLGSTVAADIGVAGGVAAGIPGAAFRGAQAGVAQLGEEAGAPQLGRDIAAFPEAFPQELMGQPGVVPEAQALASAMPGQRRAAFGSAPSIAADVAQAKQTAADVRTARQQQTAPPAAPAAPGGMPPQTALDELNRRAQAAQPQPPVAPAPAEAPPPAAPAVHDFQANTVAPAEPPSAAPARIRTLE